MKIIIGKYEGTIYPEENGYTGPSNSAPMAGVTATASSARAAPRRS
jgi:hypothetical protein